MDHMNEHHLPDECCAEPAADALTDPVLQTVPLAVGPWPTVDPFLFCVHHLDAYPSGNEAMGPDAALKGRQIGHGKYLAIHPHPRNHDALRRLRRGGRGGRLHRERVTTRRAAHPRMTRMATGIRRFDAVMRLAPWADDVHTEV